jgi:hypothetical protein
VANALDTRPTCSYYVLMVDQGPRALRLLDLEPHDTIVVRCQCGRIVEFLPGFLPLHHQIPSTTLVYDLQYRFKCRRCGRRSGFKISLRDERDRSHVVKGKIERVIVGGSDA